MKWVFGIIAAVVVVIIGAIVIIPQVVDPNDYKEEIVAGVKSATGRDLTIRDDMELSVFPTLAIRLGGVSLSNAAGFDAKNMAEIEELDLKVALMPLLSGSLEVDTVILRGLALELAKDKNGKTNWSDLGGSEDTTEQSTDGDTASGQDIAVQIKGVIIDNARLVWDDQQGGKRYEVSNLNLETGAISKGSAVPIDLSVTLTSSAPAQTMDFSLTTTVTANDTVTKIDLDGLVAKLSAAGEGLPSGGLDIEIGSNIAYDGDAGTVAISDLELSGPNLNLSGSLNGSGLNAEPAFTGEFTLAESNLKQLMALGGTPPETADPAALTKVSAEFGVQASSTSAALKPFKVKLDDSTFTGDFSIKSFTGPALRFALNLDQIDLDRYLPPRAEEGAAPAETETAAAPQSDDPLAGLRTLDLAGKVNIGSLKVLNLSTNNIAITIEGAGGVLAVSSIAADLYEGKVSGNIRLDAREKTPKLNIVNALKGIQIGPLLTDFSGNDKLLGQGSVNVNLTTQGLDANVIKRHLNGSIDVLLNDGAYQGVDVLGTICSIGNKLDSLIAGATGELNQSGDTKFSAMSAKLTFVDGVMHNNDLDVKSPLLRVSGEGQANLVDETVDYLVNAELVQACEGQTGAAADQLVGVPLPIRAQGSMTEPKISPDWGALGKEMAQSKIKDKAEALIKDKLNIPGLGGGEAAAGGEATTGGDAVKDVGGALKEGLKKLF